MKTDNYSVAMISIQHPKLIIMLPSIKPLILSAEREGLSVDWKISQ
ncbi:MAG TPA: hypothetical protein VFG90_07650 [Nitrososphaeraceae archaeon]|nr:hypothetical protein [Nitrososphaeraceae archaeon]